MRAPVLVRGIRVQSGKGNSMKSIFISPRPTSRWVAAGALLAGVSVFGLIENRRSVQANGPTVVDPNLEVRTVAGGLNQPISMAFLGPNDILVLEKATGKVQRVVNGVIQMSPVLDLAVNSGSERGLLGIALH